MARPEGVLAELKIPQTMAATGLLYNSCEVSPGRRDARPLHHVPNRHPAIRVRTEQSPARWAAGHGPAPCDKSEIRAARLSRRRSRGIHNSRDTVPILEAGWK